MQHLSSLIKKDLVRENGIPYDLVLARILKMATQIWPQYMFIEIKTMNMHFYWVIMHYIVKPYHINNIKGKILNHLLKVDLFWKSEQKNWVSYVSFLKVCVCVPLMPSHLLTKTLFVWHCQTGTGAIHCEGVQVICIDLVHQLWKDWERERYPVILSNRYRYNALRGS